MNKYRFGYMRERKGKIEYEEVTINYRLNIKTINITNAKYSHAFHRTTS
jgi:hypothetical protein